MLLINTARKNRFNKDALLLCILPSIAVLVAMLGVSSWVWVTSKNDVIKDKNSIIQQRTNALENLLVSRFASYEEVLRGTAALLETSQSVSREDMHAIIDTYDVQNRFPGVHALGYAPIIQKSDIQAYEQLIRENVSPTFTVTDIGEASFVIPIQYIEPQTESNLSAMGFNMYSDQSRRESFDRAGESGEVVITGKVNPRAKNIASNAFQMYFPVYSKTCTGTAAVRSKCPIVGYVYAGFVAEDLMKALLASNQSIRDNFAIYDTNTLTRENLLFATSGFSDTAAASYSTLQLYSRTWTLSVQVPESAFTRQLRSKPELILAAGIILSISSSAFIYILLLQRVRSLQQAKDSEVQMVKDDLLALAAHQLRTPATAVKQYLIMAVEGYGGDLSKEQKNLVQKAYDNNERQLRTVNEMLYVANADAGKLRLIHRSVDLVQLVREAADEQRGASNEKRHRLNVTLPKTPLYYDADELYLRMAVSNLISNAIKYTPDAGKIDVGLKITPRNIHISVKDNGVGISKKQLPDLFKKFSRLENPLSAHAMGNGLGLYLSRRVVELHKGRIKVASEHTIGSEFTIILPRPKANEDTSAHKKTGKED